MEMADAGPDNVNMGVTSLERGNEDNDTVDINSGINSTHMDVTEYEDDTAATGGAKRGDPSITSSNTATPRNAGTPISKSAGEGIRGGNEKAARLIGDDGKEVSPFTPVPAIRNRASGKASASINRSPGMVNTLSTLSKGKKRAASSMFQQDDEDDEYDEHDEDNGEDYRSDDADDQVFGNDKRKKKSAGSEKRKRQKGMRKPIERVPIGTTWEDLAEADQMMITMFEGGSPWPEIATKWQKMTGRKAQKSTLPNRYQRIKDKLVVMRDEDRVFMLEARSEVNTAWETERWERMAALIEEKGGQKYTGDEVKREYKKVMEKGLRDVPV